MPDTRLFHATIFMYDVETGERASVAVQVATSATKLAYTIRSMADPDRAPVTLVSEDRGQCQLMREIVDAIERVSIPA